MKNKVIIAIPIYRDINGYEKISLIQALRLLKKYKINFFHPSSLDLTFLRKILKDYDISYSFNSFSDWHFNSISGYNKLLTSLKFYKTYQSFNYLLIYQLDAFVFKDQLDYWCSKNYDYIGAPWLENMSRAKVTSPYIGVGNGGFSLRKTSSCIKVLTTLKRIKTWRQYNSYFSKMNWKGKLWHLPNHLYGFFVQNNFFHTINDFQDNEDDFWCNYAAQKFDWFKVAPINDALKFSMEVQPRKMFSDNNDQLPFGCHAWWKYDISFWKPFIEHYGHIL